MSSTDYRGASSKSWDSFWRRSRGSGHAGQGRVSWSKRRIMSILDRHVRPGMTTLDAGCGSGFFCGYFIDKGCQAYALDYSEAALEAARRTTGDKAAGYLMANLLGDAFPAEHREAFDLVFTDGLFEHFDAAAQRTILANFVRVLKPGGTIATFCPNRYSPWQLIRPLYMPGISERPFDLRGLQALHADLQLLESGGLNVLPIRLSPELIGGMVGMILYCIATTPAR